MCIESVKKYNKRIAKAIQTFQSKSGSVAILGKGRNVDEQSLVLVENGSYKGFGFVHKDVPISDFESARTYVRSSVETPTVQNLINSYLNNPRGADVVVF